MKIFDLLCERITSDELAQWRSEFDQLSLAQVKVDVEHEMVQVIFNLYGNKGTATFFQREKSRQQFVKRLYAAARSASKGKNPGSLLQVIQTLDYRYLRPHARFILTNPRYFTLSSIKHPDINYPNSVSRQN